MTEPPASRPLVKVSILLPNLNHRFFLEERLRSILSQTFEDWELVIVDNYSDDGAWEFFQSWQKRDPRIRISQAQRRGMYDNWNNCIRLAGGHYVTIATSDDTMAPDFLERMVKALDDNPDCDLAHCKLRIIDGNGGPSADFDWDQFFCAKFFEGWIDKAHIRRAPFDGVLHCGVRTVYTSITQLLIRRRLFDRVGLFSTRFGSAADFEWGMRASLLAHTVHVPDYLATWRVHGLQGTDTKQLDSARQKRKMVQMVRHAFRAARRVDPEGLRFLRLSELTALYRKEWLCAEIWKDQRDPDLGALSWPRRIGLGLAWLCRDPLVFLGFYRQRRNWRSFLAPLAPLEYPRQLIKKYGLAKNLVALASDSLIEPVPMPTSAACPDEPLSETATCEHWTIEDQQIAETLKRTDSWLFANPPPIAIDESCPPIFVYQMGRVGSTSVVYSLKEHGFPHPIYHVHQLTPEGIDWTIRHTQDSLRQTLENRSLNPHLRVHTSLYLKLVLREYRHHLELQEEIRRNLGRFPWRIITLVRDPVMRQISDFFFSLHLHPELLALQGKPLKKACLPALEAALEREFLRDDPWVLSWFDSELQKVFHVDVYQFPFDAERGYSILEAGNIRILIFKLEKLSLCFSEAMGKFLHIHGLELINQNTAQQKHYYDVYRYAQKRATLDPKLCRQIYQSKHCQHFYTSAERSKWIRRWTKHFKNKDRPLN